jgi:hypothetical protein
MSYLQRACAVVVAWQLGGCAQILGIEELTEGAHDAAVEEPATYTVRGTAVGLLEPVTVRLEHPGGVELLRVEEDGTFAFAAELAGGALYSVTFVGEPPCVLADANGAAEGSTIPLVSLACESVLLDGLSLSGATAPALDFAPARRTYQAEVSLLQQFVHVTATATSPDASISVDGVPIASGVPSEPIALALGDNSIQIAVANKRGAERIYSLSVARAAEMAQYVYAKASNTDKTDLFGESLALWGDTLVVGAPGEDSGRDNLDGRPGDDNCDGCGAVYVFRRKGSSWMQEAFLKASNPGPVDGFGTNVAIWGNLLVVGAPYEDSGSSGIDGDQNDDSANASGAAYVFRREGTLWAQEAYLKASNTEESDAFGRSVALWDGVLAVGATGEDSGAPGVNGDQSDNSMQDSGAVYIFTRDGSSWSQEAYIKASNPGNSGNGVTVFGNRFGTSLTLWHDMLAVGAVGENSAATGVNGDQNDSSASSSGAAYVFRRTNAGWAQEAYIKASNTGAEDRFGVSVSLWGDLLAVGASLEDSSAIGISGDQSNNDATNSGAVYLFRRAGTTWTQEAYVKASNTNMGDLFGRSVTLYGESLAVGASAEASSATGINGDEDDNSLSGSGAVYLFRRSAESWIHDGYLKASNPGGTSLSNFFGDSFGASTALWEDTLVVAAPYEGSNAIGVNGDQQNESAGSSGAVYIFH